MAFNMKPTSVIIARLGLEPNGKVQRFFTNECARAMDKYVPFDTGTLAKTVIVGGEPTKNVGYNTITYNTPYARYIYYGITKNGKSMVIKTDKHSFATTKWDKEMWTAEGNDIVKSVQKYVDRGGK